MVTVTAGGRSQGDNRHPGHEQRGCCRRSGRRCGRCRAGHRDIRPAVRTAACRPGEGWPKVRPRRTPAPQRQRSPEAARQSLAVRVAGTRPRTAAQVLPSPAGRSAARQILANGGHISARLATFKSGQALGDTGHCGRVAEDLQGHLQTLEVVNREQDGLRLTVASQGYQPAFASPRRGRSWRRSGSRLSRWPGPRRRTRSAGARPWS
jgi:hypothetical protein